MSDMEQPPAKRARLDVDAPGSGTLNLDAPGSPMDDCDDDFYETAPVAPTADAAAQGGPSSSTVAAEPASIASPPLPGLGLWSEPSAAQTSLEAALSLPEGEGVEDGEVSEEESFYSEAKPGASATQNPPAVDSLPQQNGHAEAAAVPPHVPNGNLSLPSQPAGPSGAEAPVEPAATATTVVQEDEGKTEFLQAAAANKGNTEAEWQLDSEASDSDSSSDSSSSDSSSEEGEESDGELLSPEEAIRRMMAEDPDDAEPAAGTKVKTQNEQDEVFEKPDIKMQDDTKITELGKVESIVENMVVVKGNTHGNEKVLGSGSALCLANRTIIGQVSEAIGRVQEPRYSVGFTDPAEIGTLEIAKGTPIYYVDEHTNFVLTEPLRTEKHTDASGQYDEEARNQEFSDDEQEAAHKRKQKQEKQTKRDGPGEPPFEPPRGPSMDRPQPAPYQGGALKYSDDDDDEDLGMYKPLARPDRFEEIVGHGAPIEDRSHVRRGMMRGGRGGWQDRGRGFRGRGGGRGDRGGMNQGRGDRAGVNQGGRNDRGERPFRGQGDRNDRSNRGPPERGDRSSRGQGDRGRHQEQRGSRSGAQRDHSNNRQGGHLSAGSPPRQMQGNQQPQRSPARNKKSRKRNRRSSDRSSQQPPQGPQGPQAPAAANVNAYASNNAPNAAAWNTPSAYNTPTAAASHAPPAAPAQPPAPSYTGAPYAAPAYYPQQAAAPAAAPVADQAQWAQWYQLAQAISQAQSAQQQAPQPHAQAQAQPAPQAPYYPYQYQQNSAPAANTQQPSTQPVGSSLSDILRALGNASQGR